jgi:hypothetical protein
LMIKFLKKSMLFNEFSSSTKSFSRGSSKIQWF